MRLVPHSGLATATPHRVRVSSLSECHREWRARAIATAVAACQKQMMLRQGPVAGVSAAAYGSAAARRQDCPTPILRATAMPDDHSFPSSVSSLIAARPAAPLAGEVRVPGDKSISHRALMFGALAVG